MSCLGPNYVITNAPPWSRKASTCFNIENIISNRLDSSGNEFVYIPLLKRSVLISEISNALDMYNKANVLQYAYNSGTNRLTKNQKYALICKRKWSTRKTFATQTETYSNPNMQLLERVNYGTVNLATGVQTIVPEPITCPSGNPVPTPSVLPVNNNTPSNIPNILPGPPPTPSNNKFTLPDIFPVVNESIQRIAADGGNLIIGTISDICTGKTKNICEQEPFVCFPSSASNVPPEDGIDYNLCFVRDAPVWLPKKSAQASSNNNNNSTNKNFKDYSPA
jgi:hypothetical protein